MLPILHNPTHINRWEMFVRLFIVNVSGQYMPYMSIYVCSGNPPQYADFLRFTFGLRLWVMIVTIGRSFTNIAPYYRMRLNIVDIRIIYYRPMTCSDY